ncbi:MAG: sensor histidine kinase [Vicinamibacterales bacterium]
MKRITSRFVLLVATAAVLPLVIFGALSISSLRSGTKSSIREGNQKVAEQVSEQVTMYMQHNTRVLLSVGTEFGATEMAPWQQDRILKDYVLSFPEFREITIFSRAAEPVVSSAQSATRLVVPDVARKRSDQSYIAPLSFDDDGLPTTTIAVRLTRSRQPAGWVVGEIALEELWKMVNRIRVGATGYALIVGEDGRLIAHGNPDKRRRIADSDQTRASAAIVFASEFRNGKESYKEYTDEYQQQMMAVAAAVKQPLPLWTVVVEQPRSEAMAAALTNEKLLLGAIFLALLGTVVFGYLWARGFIRRIFALTKVTRSIAEGKLETRVEISGHDEIRELGDAFNSMADRLVELQEDIRKQERQVMFGRIAAGLVHDLSHPIMNIGNGCKLIVKMWDDVDYRETFRRMFERELQLVKRVLEDLQNIAKPIPLERFPVELNRSVGEVIESMQALADTAGVTLQSQLSSEELYVEGDVFALGRVYRNLVVNAIQATAPGGLVVAAVEGHGERVQIRVYDTGCGIPADRLQAVFEDFVTTKRRGLGLGLAITRKIVEQLGGRISVASEVGKGTTFVIDFPRTSARPMAQAAG